jgi:SAM-dependent methyltransferase
MGPARREIAASEGQRLFGLDPAAYDSGRAAYPERIFDVLVERCGLAEGTPTLEIGPGTGQATAGLLSRGAQPVVAVEPDPSFADFLSDRFRAGLVDVVRKPFEQADLPAGGFALAASATAFHWVEQTRGLAKIACVLRPGGWWAVWWMSHYDPAPPDELYQALDLIMEALPIPWGAKGAGGTPFPFDRVSRIADLRQAKAFHRIAVEEVRTPLVLDPARARTLFSTFSPLLALDADERERVLDRIARLIAEEFGGSYERTCVTVLYTAQRI